jgi:FAD/FMN-containing dehydrogenase
MYKEDDMLATASINQLEKTLHGNLIRPGDPGYDEARSLYNAMIDKHPRLIVQCATVNDVVAAVNFGREEHLDTAIRGGGHSAPGLAMVEDGLVIDLSPMKDIQVNPHRRTVRVEAGCRWGEVDQATHEHGLATVSGFIANTGVAGLTLGGGHGYLSRKYGLTIDNLLSAEVVLADGRFVYANAQENPDLFWALRGGGGNFGVVTAFEFYLHPVDTVIAGPLFWPLDALEDALRWYREWLPQAPEDVNAFFLIGQVPPADPFPKEIQGQNICGLQWCYLGSEETLSEVIQPARDVAKPLFEHVGPMPYPVLQSIFDDLYPPGLQWYWKGDFVKELTDEAIAIHRRFAEVPTPHSVMHMYPIDGAVHRVGPEETAWSYRDATWSMIFAGADPDPANSEKIKSWARDYWEAMHPHTGGASYVNFMMEEGQERVQATYGSNYDRLRQVKAKYDPDNFFHVNQNIEPA